MYLQPGNRIQATPADAGGSDSEEEPEINMSSFMSGDPNFNRETSDSQGMTKALDTLKFHLSSYAQMRQYRPAMLVFLHCLLARKEAKWYKPLTIVYFDWLSEDWKQAAFEAKLAKRTAFAIYSTFLNREGPLALEACIRVLDPSLGLGKPSLDDSIRAMSELFARRPIDSHVERIAARLGEAQAQLLPALEALTASVNAELATKRRDGFVSDILPGVDSLRPGQTEDRQQRFIEQSRSIMMAHFNYLLKAPFGGPMEAGCLASLMERLFKLQTRAELPADLPLFNSQRPRAGKSLLNQNERRGTHFLKPVELDKIMACAACGKLLCGPGPQAMRCRLGDCQVVSHRACIDQVKPISCSSAAGLLKRSSASKESTSNPPLASVARWFASSAGQARTAGGESKTDLPEASTAQPPSSASHHQQHPQAPQHPQQPHQQLAPTPQIRVDTAGGATPASVGASFRRVSGAGDAASAAEGNNESGSLLLSPSEVSMELDPQALDDGAPVSPNLTGQQEDDTAVSQHPDIAGVPADFQGYIEALDIGKRLQQLSRPASGSKEAERFKEYQLALHEVAFSSKSHLRALTLLQLVFVQPWPQANRHVLQQLGLHFVSECIALYRSLLDCVMGGANQADYQQKGLLDKFGERLLAWYSQEANSLNFQRLGLSFGFAKTSTRRKTASINEDDIILRLIGLRREDPQFNRFFALAETNPAMNKRRFVDLYSVHMQQTMRMVTLLDTAARKAKKAKDACDFAEKDAENLEKCTARAKAISDYCNSTGAKLKELSRQLVLSKSFENFWERANSDDSHLGRFKGQISHLHTCQLHLTREVLMPGLEGYRLRLFVFTEFLLVISESEEARGVKYQLLKQLGPSMSVDSQQPQPTQQQQQPTTEKASLIEANCPPVIPMDSVVHIFDTASEARRRLPGSRAVDAEFRIIVEQTILGAGGRVKPLMLEFRMSQDKPLMSFFPSETQQQAGEFVDCVKGLAPRLSGNRAWLDRHSSLSGSALDLSPRPALPGHEHRRVHSSAGLSVAKPPAGALQATAAAASRLMPSGDESDAESIDEKLERPPAAPDSQSSDAASAAAAAAAVAAPSSNMALVRENLTRMEALLKEQQAVLPEALGLSWQGCQDAFSLAKSDQVPSRSEKILLAWRLMAETHRALTDLLPSLDSPLLPTFMQQVDSSLNQLSCFVKATAECIARDVCQDSSSVDIRPRANSNGVSEASNDNQTQPPQESLLVERRAQFSAQATAPPIPPPRPSKPQIIAAAAAAATSTTTAGTTPAPKAPPATAAVPSATAAPADTAGATKGQQHSQAPAAATSKADSTPAQNNNNKDDDDSSSSSTDSTDSETDSEDYSSSDASDADEPPPPRPASTASAKNTSDV